MPLEAAIARAGGFDGIAAAEIGHISILLLNGRGPVEPKKPIELEHIGKALQGLQQLIDNYDNPSTPYVSRRAPMFTKFSGDYDHLARVREWSVLNGDIIDEAGE